MNECCRFSSPRNGCNRIFVTTAPFKVFVYFLIPLRMLLLTYVLLLGAVTATSVWHVLGKLALTHGMDASVFMVYRFLLTSCVLLFALKWVLRVPLVVPEREHYLRIFLLGLVTFIHSIMFVYGLQLTNPFLCAVMQPSVPVFVWLLSVTMGVERASLRKGLGVALCSIGAVGAAASSSHHAAETSSAAISSDFHTGTILIVIQCVFYAVHLVFQQPLFHTFPPVQVTAMLYLVAGVITFAVTAARTAFPLGTSSPYWQLSHDPTAWLALGFCVLFASAFTHGVYSWASKRVAPTTVSCFITIEPITTTIVSLVITQSGLPTLLEAACAGIVALGVALVLRGGSTHAIEKYEPISSSDHTEEFELEEVRSQPVSPAVKRKPSVVAV